MSRQTHDVTKNHEDMKQLPTDHS